MKKIIAIFSMFSILFSLTACNQPAQSDFNIAEIKKILLGKEVNSVVLTTSAGEKITYDTTADFYDIFNKVDFAYEAGEKYSYIAEMKLHDQSKSFIEMNAYYLQDADFYEFRTKKEGDNAVATMEEYAYQKQTEENTLEMSTFCRYTYKDEKAFGGSEMNANGYVIYSSDAYPLIPQSGTELCEMQARSGNLRALVQWTDFFQNYEPFEAGGKTYDYNEFITREYTLYENYIVFKQTAPFLHVNIGLGQDLYLLYMQFLNADCSITQEAYCNVKTGEIEYVKVYGNTIFHTPEFWGRNLELNMQLYIHDIGESEGQQKVDNLIHYVKSNAD